MRRHVASVDAGHTLTVQLSVSQIVWMVGARPSALGTKLIFTYQYIARSSRR